MAFSPDRLDHAVLFVTDLERAVRFYTDVFGMEVVAGEPRLRAAFLRLARSGNHHDLRLMGVGPTAVPTSRRGVGIWHLAWQLDTIEELTGACRVLLHAGAYTGESSHGATKSLYGANPDGNEFEVMWMLARAKWGAFDRAAPMDHVDFSGDVERSGGVTTAGRIVNDAAGTP